MCSDPTKESDMEKLLSLICGTCTSDGRSATEGVLSTSHDHSSATQKSEFTTFQGPDARVSGVLYRPTCSQVIFGNADGEIGSYNILSGDSICEWPRHSKAVSQLKPFGTEGFLTASRDQTAKLWSYDSQSPRRTFSNHHQLIISAVSSNQFDKVVTGSRDTSVALWDVETGSILSSNQVARNLVTDLCWKGKLIAQTSEDKRLRLWSCDTMTVEFEFAVKTQILTSCDMKSDYILTSSGGFNGLGCHITVWDRRNGNQPVRELLGHQEKVHQVVFLSADKSNHAISIAADQRAIIWDVDSGSMIASANLPYQPTCITQLDHPSYSFLFAIGDTDGGINVLSDSHLSWR